MRKLGYGVMLLVAVVLAACGGPGISAAQYRKNAVSSKGARARALPGAPREAMDYAMELLEALKAGAYLGKPGQPDPALPPVLSEALALLDRAAADAPAEAWRLLAIKGAVLLEVGRQPEALAALSASMQITPNAPAAVTLMDYYDRTAQRQQVAPLCALTLPNVGDDDTRFSFLKLCIFHQHSISADTGLAWAPPEARQWYFAEQSRRDQQAAAEEREAERRRAERQLYEQQRESDANQCIAQCKQGGHLCLARCKDQQTCPQSCENYYQACLDECDARSRAPR